MKCIKCNNSIFKNCDDEFEMCVICATLRPRTIIEDMSMSKCKVDECNKAPIVAGLCTAHAKGNPETSRLIENRNQKRRKLDKLKNITNNEVAMNANNKPELATVKEQQLVGDNENVFLIDIRLLVQSKRDSCIKYTTAKIMNIYDQALADMKNAPDQWGKINEAFSTIDEFEGIEAVFKA